MSHVRIQRVTHQHNRALLNGSALLFASTTLVNAGNYLFNLVLGRWLGPTVFADLSLVVTLLLMFTLVTATLQTISAKSTAMYVVDNNPIYIDRLRHWLGVWSWLIGACLFVLFVGGAPLWQSVFHTATIWTFAIFGAGLPCYLALSVDRGVLQGQTRFGALAVTYQVEMWARLFIAITLVALGWSVNGAVVGLTFSLVATWVTSRWLLNGRVCADMTKQSEQLPKADQQAVRTFAVPVILALVGQVLITNSDVLIVKHAFAAESAGYYAALALIGRIVFFATASVATIVLPLAAQRHQRGEPHRYILWNALGLVGAISVLIIAATALVPELLVQILFGAAYLSIVPLLWQYALATALYALANVAITYQLSLGNRSGSLFALLFGVAQVAGLLIFHHTLSEVVFVQVVLMAGLFGALLLWEWVQGALMFPISHSRSRDELADRIQGQEQ